MGRQPHQWRPIHSAAHPATQAPHGQWRSASRGTRRPSELLPR